MQKRASCPGKKPCIPIIRSCVKFIGKTMPVH